MLTTKLNLKKRWLRMSFPMNVIMLVSLILTSSRLQAQNLASIPDPQPSGFVSLDQGEQQNLAKFIKQCSLDKKNLGSYEKSYNLCIEKHELTPQWWQTPYSLGGIFILGLLTGFVVRK